MFLLLLTLSTSWNDTAVQLFIISPSQRILEFPGEFTITETASDPEPGSTRHRLVGSFGSHRVRISFFEFPDQHVELIWAEALDDPDWNCEHPSRRERSFASSLLAGELDPALPDPVRTVSYRWKRDGDDSLYQMSIMSDLGAKRMIHRVDYTNDGPDSISLIQVIDIGDVV